VRFQSAASEIHKLLGDVMKLMPDSQEWSTRYRPVDGQGNFDLLTATAPAAMRYTEAGNAQDFRRNTADMKKRNC
jgi:DNA gyrase/topoisomerase IV subunit A